MTRIILSSLLVLILFAGCNDDPCKDIDCINGNCVEGICGCDNGYEGTFCDTEIRAKFLGVWVGPSQCAGVNEPATIEITAGNGGVFEIILNDDISNELIFPATVDGTNFTFSENILVAGQAIFVMGNATLESNNTLSMVNYLSQSGVGEVMCSYSLTKQ